MLDLSFRKADSNDSEALVILLAQLGYETDFEKIGSYLESEQREDEIYVAELANDIVGLVSFVCFFYFPTQEKSFRITSLVVSEISRRLGIGRQIIQFVEEEAARRNCVKVELTTSISRENAHRFYDSMGFKKLSYRFAKVLD